MLPTPTAQLANPLVMTPTRRCRRAYRCASTWSRCYARATRYVENSRPGASANSPSSFDTPRQRQTKLRATSSLGQPRPVGRYALIGRPYGDRPCFPHMQATRTCTARAAMQCSPCVAATLRSSCGSSASAPPRACCSSAICSPPSNTWPQSEAQCRASFARERISAQAVVTLPYFSVGFMRTRRASLIYVIYYILPRHSKRGRELTGQFGLRTPHSAFAAHKKSKYVPNNE